MRDKINLLFKPFLFIHIGLIIGYTFLHWVIFIEFELFSIKEGVTNFIIPFILTGITAWLILRPRFKILNLETENGNWRDFYSFILWLILSAPLIISQEYISSASGRLTELKSINEINNTKLTKYYTLEDYYIDKSKIGVYTSFDVSGKYNGNYNMHIYVALPIFEKSIDTNGVEPLAWMGIEYKETISNHLGLSEKEDKYQYFANETQKDFDNANVSDFKYLDRLSYSDKKEGFIQAIKNNGFYKPSQMIFEGINKPFEARSGTKLYWIIGSFIFGVIIWLLMLITPRYDKVQLERIKAGIPDEEAKEDLKDFLDFLKLKNDYVVTMILIYINIGLFILMIIMGLGFTSFDAQDLVQWGANYKPLTMGGDWWRLFTSTFLHGGLMHLISNMYGLLFVGIFLEHKIGSLRYAVIYILSGVLGSIASLWWYDATISVGASGAIFGLYGVFIVLLLTKIFPSDFAKSFLISTSVFVGVNLLLGFTGGIDNAAHIGGLVSGFIIGLIIYPSIKRMVDNDVDE